jgi:hypothetical protein
MPSLGSLTGWRVGFKKDAKEEIKRRIEKREKREVEYIDE